MSIRITAYGHENILGTHPTTFEVTKEETLTKRGDCIIGVRASHSLADLREELLAWRGERIRVVLLVDGLVEKVRAYIHPQLEFTDASVVIVRKSSFLCSRTLAVRADKAARDFDREMMERMRDPEQEMVMEIEPMDDGETST